MAILSYLEEMIVRATSNKPAPPKAKHVRNIVLESHERGGSSQLLKEIFKRPLEKKRICCWKSLYIIHRVLLDGHPSMTEGLYEHRKVLLSLSNYYRNVLDEYGKLIFQYAFYLISVIDFRHTYPRINSNMSLKDDKEADANLPYPYMISVTSHLLELQKSLLDVQCAIMSFDKLVDCKLMVLVPLIAESYNIYTLSLYFTKRLAKIDPDDPVFLYIKDVILSQRPLLENFYSAPSIRLISSFVKIPVLPTLQKSDFKRRQQRNMHSPGESSLREDNVVPLNGHAVSPATTSAYHATPGAGALTKHERDIEMNAELFASIVGNFGIEEQQSQVELGNAAPPVDELRKPGAQPSNAPSDSYADSTASSLSRQQQLPTAQMVNSPADQSWIGMNQKNGNLSDVQFWKASMSSPATDSHQPSSDVRRGDDDNNRPMAEENERRLVNSPPLVPTDMPIIYSNEYEAMVRNLLCMASEQVNFALKISSENVVEQFDAKKGRSDLSSLLLNLGHAYTHLENQFFGRSDTFMPCIDVYILMERIILQMNQLNQFDYIGKELRFKFMAQFLPLMRDFLRQVESYRYAKLDPSHVEMARRQTEVIRNWIFYFNEQIEMLADVTRSASPSSKVVDLEKEARAEMYQAVKKIADITNNLISQQSQQAAAVTADEKSPDVTAARLVPSFGTIMNDGNSTNKYTDLMCRVSSAVQALLEASMDAQDQLIQLGRVFDATIPKYNDDPLWSEGFVSAAHAVVETTKILIQTFQENEQQLDDSKAIAILKMINMTTSRLVTAIRVKLPDPASEPYVAVNRASNDLFSATTAFTDTLKAQRVESHAHPVKRYEQIAESIKAEIEQQAKIISLEKELKSAQDSLHLINKQKYMGQNPPPVYYPVGTTECFNPPNPPPFPPQLRNELSQEPFPTYGQKK